MKAFVVARKPIIQASTGKRFNDAELAILDGIRYGQECEIPELTPEIADRMVDEFQKKNPEFYYAEFEVIEMK